MAGSTSQPAACRASAPASPRAACPAGLGCTRSTDQPARVLSASTAPRSSTWTRRSAASSSTTALTCATRAETSRLSREKRPGLALDALRELHRRKVRAHLVVAGDGPMRKQLVDASRGMPVDWRGFVRDRVELADLMAAADVVLAPGPVETFGLAALEAMACGTPVVVNRHSALPEVVGEAGRTSPSSGFTFADAVQQVLALDEVERRTVARRRAEGFQWSRTVAGFLDVHEGRGAERRAA